MKEEIHQKRKNRVMTDVSSAITPFRAILTHTAPFPAAKLRQQEEEKPPKHLNCSPLSYLLQGENAVVIMAMAPREAHRGERSFEFKTFSIWLACRHDLLPARELFPAARCHLAAARVNKASQGEHLRGRNGPSFKWLTTYFYARPHPPHPLGIILPLRSSPAVLSSVPS